MSVAYLRQAGPRRTYDSTVTANRVPTLSLADGVGPWIYSIESYWAAWSYMSATWSYHLCQNRTQLTSHGSLSTQTWLEPILSFSLLWQSDGFVTSEIGALTPQRWTNRLHRHQQPQCCALWPEAVAKILFSWSESYWSTIRWLDSEKAIGSWSRMKAASLW